MSKKKYKKKKKNKVLRFLNEYAAVITIGMTLLAVVGNAMIAYHKKASSTDFYFEYLTVKMDNENWVKNYQKNSSNFYHEKELKSPTMNNELNKLLYKYPKKVTGYFITYLIMKQTEEVTATDIKINFKEYKNIKSLKENDLTDCLINKKQEKQKQMKIDYPFPKEELIKIPIAICKSENDYITYPKNCYYVARKPVSIEYRNKYLFSKRRVPIREYLESNVIIDGELVTGKGSASEDTTEENPWYLK